MKNQAVLFFLKYPESGKVKTRLGIELGYDNAARLYRAFINDMLRNLKKAKQEIIICADPDSELKLYQEMLGDDLKIIFQRGNDIGERMFHAFKDVFANGIEHAVLIGSDIPTLRPEIITEAFKLLENGSPCLGPAEDGGYYLIGFNKNNLASNAFTGINWSTPAVLQLTYQKMKELGFKPGILPKLNDIDTLNDLKKLRLQADFLNLCTETSQVLEKIGFNSQKKWKLEKTQASIIK